MRSAAPLAIALAVTGCLGLGAPTAHLVLVSDQMALDRTAAVSVDFGEACVPVEVPSGNDVLEVTVSGHIGLRAPKLVILRDFGSVDRSWGFVAAEGNLSLVVSEEHEGTLVLYAPTLDGPALAEIAWGSGVVEVDGQPLIDSDTLVIDRRYAATTSTGDEPVEVRHRLHLSYFADVPVRKRWSGICD
jgi:hypothetical protein